MKTTSTYSLNRIKKIALYGAITSASLTASNAIAQTWDGGGVNDNWSTGLNWSGDVAPASAITTDVVFAGSTRLTPNTDAAWTLRTMTISVGAGAFQFSGSPITLYGTGGGDSSPMFTNNSANATIVNNNISVGSGASNGGQFLNAAGGITFNGNIAMNRNTGFANYSTSNNLTVNGILSGAGAINFNGTAGAKIVINGTNSYTGNTNIYNSTVLLGGNVLTGSNSTLGNSTVAINLGASSAATTPTLLTNGAFTVDRAIRIVSPSSGVTTATIGGNTTGASSFLRAVTMGSDSGVAQALSVTAIAGGRVNIDGNLVRATGATGSADNLTKTGAGIVALNGSSNSYSGLTNVNVGTLLVNGTLNSGGGAVNVAANATLGGNGIINRSVSVLGSGTLSPGDMGPGGSLGGTLTLGSGLSLANSSVLAFNLDTPISLLDDAIAITGSLTLDGILNVTSSGNLSQGAYTLFTYTGILTDNVLTMGTISLAVGDTASINTSTLGVITLSVVPEPATCALVCVAAGALILLRRKRRS
jgi:autotransporter-associated beta strand protein